MVHLLESLEQELPLILYRVHYLTLIFLELQQSVGILLLNLHIQFQQELGQYQMEHRLLLAVQVC